MIRDYSIINDTIQQTCCISCVSCISSHSSPTNTHLCSYMAFFLACDLTDLCDPSDLLSGQYYVVGSQYYIKNSSHRSTPTMIQCSINALNCSIIFMSINSNRNPSTSSTIKHSEGGGNPTITISCNLSVCVVEVLNHTMGVLGERHYTAEDLFIHTASNTAQLS